MARTFRSNPTKMPIKNKKVVKDGTPKSPSVHCKNHGLCSYCRSNRTHKHKKAADSSNLHRELDNID